MQTHMEELEQPTETPRSYFKKNEWQLRMWLDSGYTMKSIYNTVKEDFPGGYRTFLRHCERLRDAVRRSDTPRGGIRVPERQPGESGIRLRELDGPAAGRQESPGGVRRLESWGAAEGGAE